MLSLAAVCTDYSTSGENVLCCAGARARVGLTGLTVAEYFRDEEGQDVLLFVDNIFRFTQACSEVSLRGRFCGRQETQILRTCAKSSQRSEARTPLLLGFLRYSKLVRYRRIRIRLHTEEKEKAHIAH